MAGRLIWLQLLLLIFGVFFETSKGQGNSSYTLYFADSRRQNIFKMLASGGSQSPVGGSVQFVSPAAVTHDPIRNLIYWTDVALDIRDFPLYKGIGELSLATGSTRFISLPWNSIPDGMDVDYISNLLYITDRGNKVIQVLDFEEKTYKTLLRTGLSHPRGIVVHPEQGWMYWTDFGTPAKIEKAKMDGTDRRELVTTNLLWPFSLALDKPGGRLYFSDANYGFVQSVLFDGTGRRTHFESITGNYRFFGLALDESNIYLTSWNRRYILRMSKTAIRASSLYQLGEVPSLETKFNGIVLTGSSYHQPGSNACSVRNGGCSHYCLAIPGGRVCSCPVGMELNVQLCEQSTSMLYFVDSVRENIFGMYASGSNHRPMGRSTSFVNPIAIAHDPVRGYIYWTNRAADNSTMAYRKGIGRLSITTGKTDFISLPIDSIPDGLAVDHISNLLYLTDTGNDVIQVIDFNKKTNKTIIGLNLLEPRAIVVDPHSGWMYWSDWGSRPAIEKAKMDGSGRTVLVTDGLTWPNGLALDKSANRLYFCESNSPAFVESVRLDGNNRIIHFTGSYQFFGIALDDNFIYLTAWKHRYILRLSKSAIRATYLERLGEVPGSQTRLNGIVIVRSSYREPGSNACSVQNGGCSHYCLPVPGGRVCSCPDGIQQCVQDPESLTTLSTQKEEKNTNADDKDKTGEEDNFGKSLKFPLFGLLAIPVVFIVVLAVVCCLKRKKAPERQENAENEPNEEYNEINELEITAVSRACGFYNETGFYENPIARVEGKQSYKVPVSSIYTNLQRN